MWYDVRGVVVLSIEQPLKTADFDTQRNVVGEGRRAQFNIILARRIDWGWSRVLGALGTRLAADWGVVAPTD